jgi:predicted nucleic acid-binding protein
MGGNAFRDTPGPVGFGGAETAGRAFVILVDTSVWIEVFRKQRSLDLESLVAFDEVVVCLPIVQEVLQGIRDEASYRVARDALLSMPMIESPMPDEVFLEAAQLYRAARRAGLTIRSGVDCLIAACAIRHDVTVLHRDRDFAALARVSSLKARQVARPASQERT